MNTAESAIPFAIFANVLPVHGAMISKSRSFLGPIGSASFTVLIISLPHLDFNVSAKYSLVPKRVSVL